MNIKSTNSVIIDVINFHFNLLHYIVHYPLNFQCMKTQGQFPNFGNILFCLVLTVSFLYY